MNTQSKSINPEIRNRIVEAANSLVTEGIESPTNEQIRERLGGGSLSHISPVMREWRESRKTEMAASLEIPLDLRKAIETSLSQVWTTASKLASAAVEKVQQDAQIKIDAAATERDEALTEITQLETKITKLEKQFTEKEQEASAIRKDLGTIDKELTKIKGENTALTVRVDEKNEQILNLKNELKISQTERKSLQDELLQIAKNKSAK